MDYSREVREYAFREGTLYVATYGAELRVEGRWHQERVNPLPALIVSSHPEFRYRDASEGGVRIRGRIYRVHTGRTPHPHMRRDGTATAWTAHGGLSYHQYMNDNELPVSWDTATARRLDVMVDEACDRYVVDNPDWQKLSIRMAVESRRDNADREADRLREELSKVTAKRDRFAAALERASIRGSDINAADLDRR